MSVTDGNLTTDGAQQSVRVVGSITTTPGSGTQTVAGTVTANQGTANTVGNAWPIKVTNGTNVASVSATAGLDVNVTNTTNIPVQVSGTVPVTGQIQLKDAGGTNIANVFPSGAVKVQVDPATVAPVSSGSTTATTTLNAVTTGNGATVDFAFAKTNISLMILPSAGVNAGAVDLQVSQDGNNWVKIGNSSAALAASTPQQLTASNVAFRYARGVVSTTVTGGTVTATAMAT